MRILGLAFAGTATGQQAEMARCVGDILGLCRMQVGSVEDR